VVLADTEDTWTGIFEQAGQTYRQPGLVLFTGSTTTACGQGETASGPFYCPGDEKVYIDLAFYQLMQTRFHAAGDFAQAYVIAHEVGHHVQKLLGTTDKMEVMRKKMSESDYNRLSVRLELQADCYAGVWAHRLSSGQSPIKLDSGDIEEALNAAAAIGDDTLQKQATGHVIPETFTHGTSAQRVSWFKRGATSGDVNQCDTFQSL
jgi:predicted metalloprotease